MANNESMAATTLTKALKLNLKSSSPGQSRNLTLHIFWRASNARTFPFLKITGHAPKHWRVVGNIYSTLL